LRHPCHKKKPVPEIRNWLKKHPFGLRLRRLGHGPVDIFQTSLAIAPFDRIKITLMKLLRDYFE